MTDKNSEKEERHKKKDGKSRRRVLMQQSPLPLKNKESLFYLLAMARVRPAQHLGWYCERWDMDLGLA